MPESASVKVFARFRPFNKREVLYNHRVSQPQGAHNLWAESGANGRTWLLPCTLAHATSLVVLHNILHTSHGTSHDG